mgnify:CR=1 FL=1
MTRRRTLTLSQAREIRAKHAEGIGYAELGKLYGVGASTIRDCVKYYTYAAA